MSDAGISAPAQAFLAEHVDSVLLLEILLLLHGRREQAWSAAQISNELKMEAAWADEQLHRLCAQDVLTCAAAADDAAGTRTYRYDPKTPATAAAIDDLARAYADRRVAVISLIYSKPMDKIRSFADAFRLRGKDKPHG